MMKNLLSIPKEEKRKWSGGIRCIAFSGLSGGGRKLSLHPDAGRKYLLMLLLFTVGNKIWLCIGLPGARVSG